MHEPAEVQEMVEAPPPGPSRPSNPAYSRLGGQTVSKSFQLYADKQEVNAINALRSVTI